MNLIKLVEQPQMKENVAKIEIGDQVKVHVKIKEGSRERIQIFEGTVIGKRGTGLNETFRVRRIASGVGVERIWQIHSPLIDKVEVVRKVVVRRAKLYYLRDRVGKSAKLRTKIVSKAKSTN